MLFRSRMKSAIYRGWVRHRRHAPREHKFHYRVFMMYLDLAELPQLFESVPGWSAKGFAIARFKRSDFLGDASISLDTAVRQKVKDETGQWPSGPVRMLANLRYFGFIMNPITCYYCFAEDGETLEYVVAEVNNTPWDERHCYVLRAGDQAWLRTEFEKSFHVSPFHPMNMHYHWLNNTPSEKLVLRLGSSIDGDHVFDASLSLQREEASAKNLVNALVQYPFMTAKVALAIYWEALRLWLKQIPFHSHPESHTTPLGEG